MARQPRVYRDEERRRPDGSCPLVLDFTDANGKRHRIDSTARTEAEARRQLHRTLEKVAKAEMSGLASYRDLERKSMTFARYVEEVYLPTASPGRRESTNEAAERHKSHILPALGGKALAAITSTDIEKYIAARQEEGAAANTLKNEMVFIKAALSMAVDDELIERVPLSREARKRIRRRLKVDKAPDRYLTDEEETRLYEQLPGWLQPIVTVALHTGARRNEILFLHREDINWTRGEIIFRETKTHEGRGVDMTDTVRTTLRVATASGWTSEYVFPNTAPKKPRKDGQTNVPYEPKSVTAAFRRSARLAGIKGFRFHDLRHTAASRLVQAGIPIRTVADILGHKSIQMTMRYAHLAPNNRREAVKILDRGNGGAMERGAKAASQ